MLDSECGSWLGRGCGGKLVAAQELKGHRAVRVALCILLFVLCILLLSIIVVTVSLLVVLLNCPYPDPQVFIFYFPFSPPPWGEGQ